MASEYTTNFNLDKYASTDKPNLRDQYNSAMDKIDDQLHKLDSKYNDTSNGLFAFTQKAKEITEKYDSLNSRLTDNEASINEAKATIEDNKKIARDDAKKNADDIKENAKNIKLADGDRHSLHTMLDTVSTRVTGLNEDVDIAKQEVHNFEKKIGEFQETIKTNDQENKQAIADVDKRVNAKFDTYKHETDANVAVIKGDLKAHVKVCDEKLAKNVQDIEETKRDLTVTNKAIADQSVRDDENFLRAMQAINENKDKIKSNSEKNEAQDILISNARVKEEQDNLAQQKQIDANITQLEQHKSTLSEHDARIHDNTDKINKYHDEDVAYKKTYSEKVDNAVVKVEQFNKDLIEAKKQITDQSVRDDTNFNDVKQKYSSVKELADKHDKTLKELAYFADTTKAVLVDVNDALNNRYTKSESDAKYETVADATAHAQSLEVTQNKVDAIEEKQNNINTKTLQHDEAIQHLKENVAGRATSQDLAALKDALDKNKDGKLDFIENAEKLNQLETNMHTELEKKATRDELAQAIANAKNELATNNDAKLKDYETKADAEVAHNELKTTIQQANSAATTANATLREELTAKINDKANKNDVPSIDTIKQVVASDSETKLTEKLKNYETKEDANSKHSELTSKIDDKANKSDVPSIDTIKQAVASDSETKLTEKLKNYETKEDANSKHSELTSKIDEKANKSDVPSIDTIKQAVASDSETKLTEKLKNYETKEDANSKQGVLTIKLEGKADIKSVSTLFNHSEGGSFAGSILGRVDTTVGFNGEEYDKNPTVMRYPEQTVLTDVNFVNYKTAKIKKQIEEEIDVKANKTDVPTIDTIDNIITRNLESNPAKIGTRVHKWEKNGLTYGGDNLINVDTTIGFDPTKIGTSEYHGAIAPHDNALVDVNYVNNLVNSRSSTTGTQLSYSVYKDGSTHDKNITQASTTIGFNESTDDKTIYSQDALTTINYVKNVTTHIELKKANMLYKLETGNINGLVYVHRIINPFETNRQKYILVNQIITLGREYVWLINDGSGKQVNQIYDKKKFDGMATFMAPYADSINHYAYHSFTIEMEKRDFMITGNITFIRDNTHNIKDTLTKDLDYIEYMHIIDLH